jgi:hypothetical protein
MPSFQEFFTARKEQVDEMVDKTFSRLLENTGPLDSLIPAQNYLDSSLLVAEIERGGKTLASVIAPGQEIPTSRQTLNLTDRVMRPYFAGKKIEWTDADVERLNKLELLRSSSPAGSMVVKAIEEDFFKRMVDIVPSVYDRSMVFALQVGCGLDLDYTDPLTKARVQLSYSGKIAGHVPAALTGNARWNQPNTATPLANLQSIAETVYGTSSTTGLGVWQDTLLMHWYNLRQIASTREAKRAALSKAGAVTTDTDVIDAQYISDQQIIDLIKERTRVTNVMLMDAQYSEELENGTISNGEYLPSDYFMFLHSPKMNLKRAFIPVVGADGTMKAGVAQVTKKKEDLPYREWTTAMGACIPAVMDPRYLVARKVN